MYDPQSDPASALRSVLQALAHVVIVDNSADGHPALAHWCSDPRVTIIHHGNRGGLAGAYNAAVRWLTVERKEPTTHVVFVDEDSDASVLRPFLADPAVQARLADEDTATVAPAHRDRATGLRARHMVLQKWRWRYLEREVRGLQRVAFVINSMSVWRMDAVRSIGAYNEWLGVDHVDTEYCLRARRRGMAVFMHGDFEFAQSIGCRRAYRLFGITLQSGGHAPTRRFSIGRSTAWLACRSIWREPAFAALCFARLGYEAVGVLLAEDRRPAKLWAILRGAVVGSWAALWERASTRGESSASSN